LLTKLDVRHTEVTDDGIKAVAAACPLLTQLYVVEDDAVTDDGIKAVAAGCPLLTKLDVRYTAVTDDGIKAVAATCLPVAHTALR